MINLIKNFIKIKKYSILASFSISSYVKLSQILEFMIVSSFFNLCFHNLFRWVFVFTPIQWLVEPVINSMHLVLIVQQIDRRVRNLLLCRSSLCWRKTAIIHVFQSFYSEKKTYLKLLDFWLRIFSGAWYVGFLVSIRMYILHVCVNTIKLLNGL